MNNQEILQKLRRLNTLLVLGKRSNNLAQAIRRAMDNIASWRANADEIIAKSSVRQIFAGYGPKFIRIFNELMQTGDIAMIHELQSEFDPFFCYLCEIPGIGETMARRMYFERSIHTMDDLRIAYTNNVLQRIPAFGDSRLKAIEMILWNSQYDDSFQQLWVDMSKTDMDPVSKDENAQNSQQIKSNSDTPSETIHHASHSSMQLELFIPENVHFTDLPHEYSASDSDIFHTAQKSLSLTNEPSVDSLLNLKKDNLDENHGENTEDTNENSDDANENLDDISNEILAVLDNHSKDSTANTEDNVDRTTEFSSTDNEIHAQSCELLNILKNGEKTPEQIPAHSNYSREFIESNSALFRESPKTAEEYSDKDLEEDDLNEILKGPVESTYDPQIASELEDFIEKDLREHGIESSENKRYSSYDVSNDDIHAKHLRVHVLHAEHIEANIIHAKLIRAENIQMSSQNKPVLSSANIEQEMLYTGHVMADIIDADIVEVRTLSVHYLDARIIG